MCEENTAEDRLITHHLYGGDDEMRIRQEMVLGVGGFKALVRMGQGAHRLPHERGPFRIHGAGTDCVPHGIQ